MSSQFTKHKVGDLLKRRQEPYLIGTVVFVYHRQDDEEGPQQVVLRCMTHDKLQVGWSSDWVRYSLDEK